MPKNIVSASIGIGETQSTPVLTNEGSLAGFVITGSVVTGSQVSFLVSADGTNYYTLYNQAGTEVTIPVSGCARAYNLDENTFKPWNYLKLRLGYSGSSLAQATYPLGITFITSK